VLVVEDEAPQRSLLKALLEREGLEVETAPGVAKGLEALAGPAPDLVVTDFRMEDGTGLEVLRASRQAHPESGVVVVTAHGTVPMAVEAMRGGAFDVLVKPVDPDVLLRVVERALEHARLRRENAALRARLADRVEFDNVVAQSGVMQAVLGLVARVAPTRATALVTGESGTGKELVANLLHAHGRRPEGPFVAVNLAALPEGLVESEIFGHARGSFTGAMRDRPGRFEEADGGTLFLDEIGEVPGSLQVRLLRALQSSEIVRVGENKTRRVDVRVVAATNRDLEAEVRAGRFREDLYYRINVVRIHLPPLRERLEDLGPLAERFARAAALRHGRPPTELSREAIAWLSTYDFPGNVRELQNLIERAVLLCEGDVLRPGDVPLPRPAPSAAAPDAPFDLTRAVEDLETRMIRSALERAGGVQTRAARELGVSERVLRYKLQKYGLAAPDVPEAP
jgi:DNA-binding NtrC family response regulator